MYGGGVRRMVVLRDGSFARNCPASAGGRRRAGLERKAIHWVFGLFVNSSTENGQRMESKQKRYMSASNPGLYFGVILIVLWVVCWIVFMGFMRKVVWAGVPAITWAMIAFGVVAIIVSIIAIPVFKKFESS